MGPIMQGGVTALLCQKSKPWLQRLLCCSTSAVEHDKVFLPVFSPKVVEDEDLSGVWGKGGGGLLWLNPTGNAGGFVTPQLSVR
jgi:hypothetical protein